jgi:hypothetical protein
MVPSDVCLGANPEQDKDGISCCQQQAVQWWCGLANDENIKPT